MSVKKLIAFTLDAPEAFSLSFVLCSFLDDLYRIAHRGYEPTDEDVVRTRLRTVGVQEYSFTLETGAYFYLDSFEGHGCVIDCCTKGGESCSLVAAQSNVAHQ